LRKSQDDEILIEVKANNDKDIFCLENIDCPAMLIDLEVSCSSLRQNIIIRNLYIGEREKKVREFHGLINPETNSCFKYFIRPAVINKVMN